MHTTSTAKDALRICKGIEFGSNRNENGIIYYIRRQFHLSKQAAFTRHVDFTAKNIFIIKS